MDMYTIQEKKSYSKMLVNISDTTDIPMNCYNVGCMLWDYTPVTLNQILEKQKENN